MLKNKWFMIVVLVLAVLVIAWQFIPWLMERSSRGAPAEVAKVAEPAIEETAPELNVEAPSRGVPRAPAAPVAAGVATAATAQLGAPQVGWMSQLAVASRDTARSPFQRKNEGLGKIFDPLTKRNSAVASFVNS